MHFNCNENKSNNWEAVYKKLIFNAIIELAGNELGDEGGLRDYR